MQARVPNSFVPSGGAIGPGYGGDSLAACCALALSAHFAPGCRLTHVLRTPFERHRLAIRQGYQRGTASGRIGHHYQCRRLRRNRCSKVGPASRKWTGRRGGRRYRRPVRCYRRPVPAAGAPGGQTGRRPPGDRSAASGGAVAARGRRGGKGRPPAEASPATGHPVTGDRWPRPAATAPPLAADRSPGGRRPVWPPGGRYRSPVAADRSQSPAAPAASATSQPPAAPAAYAASQPSAAPAASAVPQSPAAPTARWQVAKKRKKRDRVTVSVSVGYVEIEGKGELVGRGTGRIQAVSPLSSLALSTVCSWTNVL